MNKILRECMYILGMPNKKFLEETPLYKKFSPGWEGFYISYKHTHILNHKVPKPPINMFCNICDSDQTLNMSNDYHDGISDIGNSVHGTTKLIRYECSACRRFQIVFLVYFGFEDVEEGKETEIYLEKVGQIPPWSIVMDKELERLLGNKSEFYKKGLICESQGYGIAAFSYYRRIVEEIIDELLISIEDLIDIRDRAKYSNALEKVKKTKVTSEKIELVKDLLPETLKPNGANPLGVLHAALSAGLHMDDEDTCLEYAESVRDALIFLVNRLMRNKEENKLFSESMKKILDRKSGSDTKSAKK